jgi:aspartate aminotransferase
VSDEIYEKLIYDGFEHISIAVIDKEIKTRTLVVNGLSKSHAMTGWRIGYTAGGGLVILQDLLR